jgi:hypothetical protein
VLPDVQARSGAHAADRLDKDAQGKTIMVPGAEIDQLAPQSRSLMPDLVVRDLTAQQVADLLEFLASSR